MMKRLLLMCVTVGGLCLSACERRAPAVQERPIHQSLCKNAEVHRLDSKLATSTLSSHPTAAVMTQTHAANREAAEFWKQYGYDFDPACMTAAMMDLKVQDDLTGRSSTALSHQDRERDTGAYSAFQKRTWLTRSVAENGSYYGQISDNTGRPKTVYVRGYYRRDGTYVRSHYRSRPRR